MSEFPLSTYNVIAVYPTQDAARAAVERLHEKADISGEHISFLQQGTDAENKSEDHVEGTTAEEMPAKVGSRAAAGGAAGAAAGGGAGFLAGLATVGIPGAGPLVGLGVWAATAYGAVAGSTFGAVAGGISKMWDLHYKDALVGGGALVGVHDDDANLVQQAGNLLADSDPRPTRVDHLDKDGNVQN